jgi:hypothetical protein
MGYAFPMAAPGEPINCFECTHFYVTWDRLRPKGCRAMGFKSREMPSIVVYKSSGVDCLRYDPKRPPAGKR